MNAIKVLYQTKKELFSEEGNVLRDQLLIEICREKGFDIQRVDEDLIEVSVGVRPFIFLRPQSNGKYEVIGDEVEFHFIKGKINLLVGEIELNQIDETIEQISKLYDEREFAGEIYEDLQLMIEEYFHTKDFNIEIQFGVPEKEYKETLIIKYNGEKKELIFHKKKDELYYKEQKVKNVEEAFKKITADN